MINPTLPPQSGSFGPPPRVFRSPIFFKRLLEATVYGCMLVVLVQLRGAAWLDWAEFAAGALICILLFVWPAAQKNRHVMLGMIVTGSLFLHLSGSPQASYWAPLHMVTYALLTWGAPQLSWPEALGAALVLNLIYVGGRTDWALGTLTLSYLPTAVADVASKFILALIAKNWYDLNEAARKTAVELAAITGSSCDLIVVLDGTGLVRSVNGACRTILGYAPDEVDGRAPELLGAPEPEAFGPLIRAGQPAYGIVKRARRKDGEYIWLEWNVEPLPELEALLCVGRDVTKRLGPAGPARE